VIQLIQPANEKNIHSGAPARVKNCGTGTFAAELFQVNAFSVSGISLLGLFATNA